MRNESPTPVVWVIHPDRDAREDLRAFIARLEFDVREFPSADAFLRVCEPGVRGCLVVDLQGPIAYELLERLRDSGDAIPAIMISERFDVPAAVRAMHAGAAALIERPYARSVLMREIRRLVAQVTTGGRMESAGPAV